MTQSELLAQMRLLTGDLIGGDAGEQELQLLRRRLAASLQQGPVEATNGDPPAGVDECLELRLLLAIAESTQELRPKGSSLILVRRQGE